MSKTYKKVTAYYPVEDYVEAELLLEVDSNIGDEELKKLVEASDLEYFEEGSGIELQSFEIVGRDYSTDPQANWRERISVYEIEDISNEEWKESYA